MDTTTIKVIDEDKAYAVLLRKLKDSKYDRIVTTGRGGLAVVQKLAYTLDLQVDIVPKRQITYINKGSLFVDDIVCTGDTIGLLPRHIDVAVLVHRKSAKFKPTFAGLVYEGNEYIKFSWEADNG